MSKDSITDLAEYLDEAAEYMSALSEICGKIAGIINMENEEDADEQMG